MSKTLQKYSNAMASICSIIGAFGILLMLVHITGDVILRHISDVPIPATIEIVSGYYMVMIAFLPLAWTEVRGEMIKVDFLSGLFQGRSEMLRAIAIDCISATIYAFMTYTTWNIAVREYQSGSFLISLGEKVWIWPSNFFLPAGLGIVTIVVLIRLYLRLTDQPDVSDQSSESSQHEH